MTVAAWVCLIVEAVLESHLDLLSYRVNLLLRDYSKQVRVRLRRSGVQSYLPFEAVDCGFDMVGIARDDV
jgi:hypothetical protein